MKKRTIAAGMAVAVLTCGCANDQQRTQAEGVAAGAAIGAVLGHLIGGRDGAAIGAIVGGVAGGAAGNEVAEKKRRYAQREDALKTAAAQSQEVAQQTRAANEILQRDIDGLERSVARLRAERMSAMQRRELVKSARQSYDEANRRLGLQLTALRGEIARQQGVLNRELALAQQTREPSPGPALRLVSAGVEDLQSQE